MASLSVIHCGLCFWQAHHSGLPHRRKSGHIGYGPTTSMLRPIRRMIDIQKRRWWETPRRCSSACNSGQRGSPSSRSARAPVYRGMGRGEYSHVALKSPSQWELSRHLKDMARARIPPSARPRGFSHVALSSLRMAVEAGEIEPSHVLSPINFFVWTLSGVKVQSYTNRDAIPKR